MKMITKEQLLISSLPRPFKGVLTTEEATKRYKATQTLVIISSYKERKFFFSDNHIFGYPTLPKDWVPHTIVLPQTIEPRPSVPNGKVDTIEKYVSVFYRDGTQLNSIDELVDILNKDDEFQLGKDYYASDCE
jgi:hypothetical protein